MAETTTYLWHPLDKAHVQNPYPTYQEYRNHHPVFQTQTGEFIISRYEDVKKILRDKHGFLVGNRLDWITRTTKYAEAKKINLSSIPEALQSFIFFKNLPDHGIWRRWVQEHWNKYSIPDDILDAKIADLIEQHDEGEFEFVSGFSKPLPVYVISHILGLPDGDKDQLVDWSYQVLRTLDLYLGYKDLLLINDAADNILRFFTELIHNPDKLNKDGLLRDLLNHNELNLDEEQYTSLAIFLFVAGQETTSGLLSAAMMHLSKHEEHFRQLRENPKIIPNAVDELLRYDSPVQLLGRIAAEDTIIRGVFVPKGSTVTLIIGSANRDEDIFENPDVLDFERSPIPHLSFGAGIHHCLGDHLARKQGAAALRYFSSKFSRIDILDRIPDWDNHVSVRRLRTLNLKLS